MALDHCKPWKGRPEEYQTEAYEVMCSERFEPSHWAWITSMCSTPMCLNVDHLICNEPVHLKYPPFVCIYCGRPADTVDHLLPRGYTGDAARHYTAVVPACRWCNSTLGARLTWTITERREIIRQKIRRKYANVLRTNDFTRAELSEFGPNLRADIETSMRAKKQVQQMLDWPVDPFYDQRALEQSGIENGYDIGLLEFDDEGLQRRVRTSLAQQSVPAWRRERRIKHLKETQAAKKAGKVA